MSPFVPWAERVPGCLVLLAFVLVAGCAPFQDTPMEAQLRRGRPIYEQGCATEACHGLDGEGIPRGKGFRVWPSAGAEFQSRNPTAQVIFDVVRSGGEASLRALSDQQIYDAIAYEMSLNDVALSAPVDSANAAFLRTGENAQLPRAGMLFPPPSNADLSSSTLSVQLPKQAENAVLRLRLTQFARALSIGQQRPPPGTDYVLTVLVLEDLTDHPLKVGPEDVNLVGGNGEQYAPLDIDLAYPVDRLRDQSIQPDHGTAALAIFALPHSQSPSQIVYTLPSGERLVLEVSQ
jgi:mono/diheme cytochrome c family protein